MHAYKTMWDTNIFHRKFFTGYFHDNSSSWIYFELWQICLFYTCTTHGVTGSAVLTQWTGLVTARAIESNGTGVFTPWTDKPILTSAEAIPVVTWRRLVHDALTPRLAVLPVSKHRLVQVDRLETFFMNRMYINFMKWLLQTTHYIYDQLHGFHFNEYYCTGIIH